jgi:hypothetical protein
MRLPPADFVARLKALCGADWDVRYNTEVNRWEFLSTSAGGMRVSQFWGWFKNPLTGVKIEPDPVSGLVPFRDLDVTAQAEVLKNLEESYIGNRHDGARSWAELSNQRIQFNKAIDAKKRRTRADDYAYALKQVDLRRPWLSDTYFTKRKQPKPTKVITFG